jgi:hypothetical protein
MDITAFRSAFPEFTDETKYPDAMLEFWYGIGETLLNADRWDSLLTQGLYLYVAHNASLQSTDVSNAEKGRTPGNTAGVITNKGVGGVSISYDAGSSFFNDAGNFNMTKYGRDYWQLAMIVGTGGKQV